MWVQFHIAYKHAIGAGLPHTGCRICWASHLNEPIEFAEIAVPAEILPRMADVEEEIRATGKVKQLELKESKDGKTAVTVRV